MMLRGLGVIKNTGPIPKAWLGRFGRTVAEQVLGAVESRMRAAREPGIELTAPAGQRVGGGQGPARASDETAGLSDWLRVESGPAWPDRDSPTSLTSRGVTQGELLSGTSFAVTAEAERNEHISLWGRGAVSRFDGREGDLTLDGEVSSAMVGVDWAHENWTAGLIVSRRRRRWRLRRPQQGPGESHVDGPLSLGAPCALRAGGRMGRRRLRHGRALGDPEEAGDGRGRRPRSARTCTSGWRRPACAGTCWTVAGTASP